MCSIQFKIANLATNKRNLHKPQTPKFLKYIIHIIITFLITSNLFGQLSNECFDNANYHRNMDLKEGHPVKEGDTVTTIIMSIDNAMENILGCRFPYSPLKSTDNKEFSFDKMKADFILVNFNYLFCDFCVSQIDSLIKIKSNSIKKIEIISFFSCQTNEISHLIDKYKGKVTFVSEADYFMNSYDLKAGRPLNYILDKNKTIIFVTRQTNTENISAFLKSK